MGKDWRNEEGEREKGGKYGKQVEAMLCQMAQTGQLGGKLGDDELKGLLDRMTGGGQTTSKVKFDRRRAAMDSDDDDLDDL